jgi:two-component system response regulator
MSDKTVLLVEDDPRDQELTMRALQKSKVQYQVVVAHDGVEALDYLFGRGVHASRDLSDAPAVVLLDLNLPRLSGLEVLRRIREDERTRYLAVVVLTSSNEDRDRMSAYERFANSYVRKPVDFEQFVTASRELGLYWMVLNLPPPRRDP